MADLYNNWTPEKLRLARLTCGLSRAEASELAGIDLEILRLIEDGQIEPSPAALDKILQVLEGSAFVISKPKEG
jgi:predicted transcriptional regulator